MIYINFINDHSLIQLPLDMRALISLKVVVVGFSNNRKDKSCILKTLMQPLGPYSWTLCGDFILEIIGDIIADVTAQS